jgi:hypothetical protein
MWLYSTQIAGQGLSAAPDHYVAPDGRSGELLQAAQIEGNLIVVDFENKTFRNEHDQNVCQEEEGVPVRAPDVDDRDCCAAQNSREIEKKVHGILENENPGWGMGLAGEIRDEEVHVVPFERGDNNGDVGSAGTAIGGAFHHGWM